MRRTDIVLVDYFDVAVLGFLLPRLLVGLVFRGFDSRPGRDLTFPDGHPQVIFAPLEVGVLPAEVGQLCVHLQTQGLYSGGQLVLRGAERNKEREN